MPAVNPQILAWARETAGLSLEDAADALKLKTARGLSGAERLREFEEGDKDPSRALLRRMANRYRRPLIAFYLNERPRKGDRGEDFRRVAGGPPPEFDPRLDALIRNVRARHDLVKSLLEDEEASPLDFVGSVGVSAGPVAVANNIRVRLAFDLAEFRRRRSVGDAFTYLRRALEKSGIFVLLIGDLGSHHSKIASTTFRGYSIADALAPFIVINDNDSQAAWAFTAFHEAAHLWLGQTGISGANNASSIERFCNDVAGHLLLPNADIVSLQGINQLGFAELVAAISQFASDRNISRRMVAYQALRASLIDGASYDLLIARFRHEWERNKTREPASEREEGGPNYYVVRRHRLGPALLGLAQRALQGGTLTPTKAAQLLAVKPVAVQALLDVTPSRAL